MSKKSTVMTEGAIWKEILFFSIPLILGNLFQQLYNTVDSIIVGNWIGSEALAAVGSSGAIINLLVGFCIGASAGAGVVVSQFFGAGNREGVRKAVHTTLAIAVAAGAILTVAGVVTTPMILRAMDTPQEVFEQSSQYLQVYFGGIFFSVIYNMSAGILNAVGNSRRSLIYLIIAAVSNIFLDIFFVVILKMGIIGAALATDISQLLSCIFILGFLMRSQESYHVRLRDIRFYDNLLGRILKIGLPTGFQNIVISISNVIVQSSVNSFGAVVMAGYAAYVKVDGFNILPVLSFSMAASTFAGQNVGAGKYDRVKKGMWVSTGMGVGYTIISGILLLIFAPQVIGVFSWQTRCSPVWNLCYEVFLPVLLAAWFLTCYGRNSPGNRKDISDNGCIPCILMCMQSYLDLGGTSNRPQTVLCYDGISGDMADRCSIDRTLCMEGKMDARGVLSNEERSIESERCIMTAFLNDFSKFYGTGEKNEAGQNLEEFLELYDPRKYETPSNTTDAVIFAYEGESCDSIDGLKVLLVKRSNHPSIGYWALPGGFANMRENLDETARRELEEETGVKGLVMEQIATYGDYDETRGPA